MIPDFSCLLEMWRKDWWESFNWWQREPDSLSRLLLYPKETSGGGSGLGAAP